MQETIVRSFVQERYAAQKRGGQHSPASRHVMEDELDMEIADADVARVMARRMPVSGQQTHRPKPQRRRDEETHIRRMAHSWMLFTLGVLTCDLMWLLASGRWAESGVCAAMAVVVYGVAGWCKR